MLQLLFSTLSRFSGNKFTTTTTVTTDVSIDADAVTGDRVSGVISKNKDGCYLVTNSARYKIHSSVDAPKLNDGDNKTGIVFIYQGKARESFEDRVYPGTLKDVEPVTSVELVSSVESVTSVEAVPSVESVPNVEPVTKPNTGITIKKSRKGYNVQEGYYRLDVYGKQNTTLWKKCIGDIWQPTLDWTVIERLIEASVLSAEITIQQAYKPFAALINRAIAAKMTTRDRAMEWWKTLSQLAREVVA